MNRPGLHRHQRVPRLSFPDNRPVRNQRRDPSWPLSTVHLSGKLPDDDYVDFLRTSCRARSALTKKPYNLSANSFDKIRSQNLSAEIERVNAAIHDAMNRRSSHERSQSDGDSVFEEYDHNGSMMSSPPASPRAVPQSSIDDVVVDNDLPPTSQAIEPATAENDPRLFQVLNLDEIDELPAIPSAPMLPSLPTPELAPVDSVPMFGPSPTYGAIEQVKEDEKQNSAQPSKQDTSLDIGGEVGPSVGNKSNAELHPKVKKLRAYGFRDGPNLEPDPNVEDLIDCPCCGIKEMLFGYCQGCKIADVPSRGMDVDFDDCDEEW